MRAVSFDRSALLQTTSVSLLNTLALACLAAVLAYWTWRWLLPVAEPSEQAGATATGDRAGLMFTAFGHSFNAFEAQLRRMSGLEDGIVDGLYRMSRPITGGYYWCPPMGETGVDLGPLLHA